jgi:hypothetical protein
MNSVATLLCCNPYIRSSFTIGLSVLEDYKGFAAMHKSRDLIHDKLPTAIWSTSTTS